MGQNADNPPVPFDFYQEEWTYKRNAHGTQITESEGHPWPPPKGSLEDVGGNFYSYKEYIEATPHGRPYRWAISDGDELPSSRWRRDTYEYTGPLFAIDFSHPNIYIQPSLASSDDELKELGATAIARTIPTNPVVNLASSLGEIMTGGIPHLLGSRLWQGKADKLRKAGDEYLNLQFGWRPLVSEISGFADVVTHADAVLKQYERDAGKVVRRRYDFPVEETSDKWTYENFQPGMNPGGFLSTPGGKLTHQRSTSKRQWFSGAYTYYLPSGYDSRNALDRYKVLADKLGLEITPATLWELTPWSWAADWFSNAGDVISNISAFQQDGLVMHYGYMMEHTVSRNTFSLENVATYNGLKLDVDNVVLVTETKRRIQASPYGFGLTWDGLSTFQKSILGALGITRGRR